MVVEEAHPTGQAATQKRKDTECFGGSTESNLRQSSIGQNNGQLLQTADRERTRQMPPTAGFEPIALVPCLDVLFTPLDRRIFARFRNPCDSGGYGEGRQRVFSEACNGLSARFDQVRGAAS